MKLIIQIPCYNEAENLPETLVALPRQIDGIDSIELLVHAKSFRNIAGIVAAAVVDHQ